MKLHIGLILSLAALTIFGSLDAFGQFVWSKDTHNPVLEGGGAGAWETEIVAPWVIYNTDSARYEMWYTGALPKGGIGFAVSNDGITWTKDSLPVLVSTPSDWDSLRVLAPSVLRENGAYKMWYTGGRSVSGNRIGYATSPDGRNWIRYAGNPVLTAGTSTWESAGVEYCSVMKTPAGYEMLYGGFDTARSLIGRAFSADGITWRRDSTNNPVLNIGAPGAWDRTLLLPRVCTNGIGWYLYYTACNAAGGNWSIGVATSIDSGTTWTKYVGNPVLTKGTSGSWDAGYIELGSVLLAGSTLHMWYDGGGAKGKAGHATSDITTSVHPSLDVLPKEFSVEQNYPNPFNPTTTIHYSLPITSYVTLKIYDMLGREVTDLVDRMESPGFKQATFNANALPTGVYTYRLTAGSFVQTKKMLLMK
jgi:predicted GH43/DUF377 family glycosyl hydrolase